MQNQAYIILLAVPLALTAFTWINVELEEIFRIDGKLYIKDGGDILRLVQE
jgi:hypothetical protein